jgi:putative transcriptional regulator
MSKTMISSKDKNLEELTGKFLISSPYSFASDVFNKSLIYVISHSEKGAMGLIINHLVNKLPANSLLKLFKDDTFRSSELVLPVYLGGPVEQERGFVLHSGEYNKNLLLRVGEGEGLAISSNIEILRDIASGSGPRHSLFVLGYTGWESGQLEEEIENNMWIVSDSSKDLIFNENSEDKWEAALYKLGIDDTSFSPRVGNC